MCVLCSVSRKHHTARARAHIPFTGLHSRVAFTPSTGVPYEGTSRMTTSLKRRHRDRVVRRVSRRFTNPTRVYATMPPKLTHSSFSPVRFLRAWGESRHKNSTLYRFKSPTTRMHPLTRCLVLASQSHYRERFLCHRSWPPALFGCKSLVSNHPTIAPCELLLTLYVLPPLCFLAFRSAHVHPVSNARRSNRPTHSPADKRHPCAHPRASLAWQVLRPGGPHRVARKATLELGLTRIVCFGSQTCNFDVLYAYLTCGNYDVRSQPF